MERSSEPEQAQPVVGDAPAIAPGVPAALHAGLARGAPLTRGTVLGLQGGAGNAAVSRMLRERRLAREAEAEGEPEAPVEPLPPSEEPEDPGGGEQEGQAEEEGAEPDDADEATFHGAPPPATGEAEPMAAGREPARGAEETETQGTGDQAEQAAEAEEGGEPDGDIADEPELEPEAQRPEAPGAPGTAVARLARLTTPTARSARKGTLSLGDKGPAVRALQRNLRTLGWYRGAVDGEYGPKTASSVKRFQTAAGLEADGVAGPSTREALSKAIKLKQEIERLRKLIGDKGGNAVQWLLKQIEQLRRRLRRYLPKQAPGKPSRPSRPRPVKDESGAAPGGPADGPGGNRQTGIVGDSDGVPVKLRRRASTNSPIVDELPFGTRLFIKSRVSGGWYYVTLASGQYGYVAASYVKRNLPEPTARLFKVNGESALEIATRFYGHLGTDGQDMRFYVNVLEYVNRGPGDRGVYQSRPGDKGHDAWKHVKTRSGFQIWVPGDAFARSLKGTVGSGSLTGGAFAKAKRVANAIEDFVIGGAAFVAGVLSGAFASVKGILVDAKDLIVSLWNVMTSSVKETVAKAKGMWDRVKRIKPGEIASSHFKRFVERWNHPDMWTRWKFRGFIAGFALVEVALLALTAGIGAGLKLAKLGRMLKGFVKDLPQTVADGFIRRFRRTGPSRRPNPNAKPGGRPVKAPESQKNPEALRGLDRENDAAEALAKAGYKVEQQPGYGKPTGRDDKDPDYKIEGRTFDCYAPSARKSPRNIWSHIKEEKIDEGQTHRVVLSLADWEGDVVVLREQFKQWPMKGLHEVLIVMKDGSVERMEL